MSSTKRDRFVRVAEVRTRKVLDDLHSLSKCAAQVSYEYTAADVEKILGAIEQGLQEVRDSFAGKKRFALQEKPKEALDAQISDAAERADGSASSLPRGPVQER